MWMNLALSLGSMLLGYLARHYDVAGRVATWLDGPHPMAPMWRAPPPSRQPPHGVLSHRVMQAIYTQVDSSVSDHFVQIRAEIRDMVSRSVRQEIESIKGAKR